MYIYRIVDSKTEKSYIGKTTKTPEERFRQHMKYHYLFKQIYKKDKYRLTLEVIDQAATEEELNILEKKYIEEFNTLAPIGFNLTEGGDGGDTSTHIDYSNRKQRKSVPAIVLTQEEQYNIIEYYLSSDHISFKDVAKKFNISEYIAIRTIDENNIPRKKWKRKHGNRLIKFSLEDKNKIHKLYKEGNSQTAIGKLFGVTQGVIKRVLDEK